MNIGITTKQFTIWVIQLMLWLLPLLGMVIYIYFIEVKSFQKEFSSEESISVHLGKDIIINDLEASSSDVLMLAKHIKFYELPPIPLEMDLEGLHREFLLLAQLKSYYAQVRFIDHNGQEKIRVNVINGKPTIVPSDELQNKASRYYFKDAFALSKGDVFVSPFDLNVEHGEIDKPYKPILRFATPVFDKYGIKRGIVILNYLGSKVINDFKEVVRHTFAETMLLNNESFWLYSIDPSQEWGFMLDTDHRFSNLYPNAWLAISSSDEGQFINEEGMFTFNTLYPSSDKLIVNHTKDKLRQEKENYWKIVSYISNDNLASDATDVKKRLSLIFVPIFLLLLSAHLLISYVRFQQKSKERLLNEVMEHSLNEIYIVDAQSLLFTQVNLGAQNNIGYSLKEMETMTPVDIIPNFTTEKLEKLVAPLRNNNQQALVFEGVHQRKDGSLYPTEAHINIMKNKVPLFVAVILDISERRKADEKINQFAYMVSNTNDMMSLVNRNFVYQSVNDAYMNKTNLTSDEIIGHSVSDILGEEFFNSTFKHNAERCFKGEIVNFETRIDFLKQKNRLLSVVYSPYYDTEYEIQGLVTSSRDITEYEQLRTSKLESIGILAGGIAHDFNNILTSLFGNIYLAKMKLSESSEANKYLDLSEQSLERAKALTNQLLTFSQGGSPVVEVENIADILHDSIKLNFSGSSVKPVLKIPSDLWTAKVDKHQLEQAFSAIMINAIQSMGSGGTVSISAENIHNINISGLADLTGNFISIRIEDEGIGIGEYEQEKIFELYFSTKKSSSGIGLSSAQRIAQKHGGQITVESEEGRGSIFTIYIPINQLIQKEVLTELTQEKDSLTIKSGRILLMDDEQFILDMTKEMLESFGHSVDISVNGTEALEKYKDAQLQGSDFDIVIMDLTIPGGMGGSEAVLKLLKIDPDAKVIVSSGYSTDAAMADFKEHGFKARLVKPFQMEELQQIINSLLD